MMKHVSEFLRLSAKNFSTKTAVVCGDKSINFKVLDELSDKVASEILRANIKKEPIFILLPKDIWCIVAFFGVIKSGNFYAIIDENSPKERLLSVTHKIKPKLLITSKNFDFSFLNIKTIFDSDFKNFKTDTALLNTAKSTFLDVDLAYILFTSGSTGTPKGFAVNHKNLIDYATWAVECFGINSTDNVANQAHFHFDKSVLDIYPSILSGATLHILKGQDWAFPDKIMGYFKDKNITQTGITPQIINYFANTNALIALPHLKRVFISGEITPVKQVKMWINAYKNAKIINLYGASEITGVCSYFVCERELKDDEILPIGKACENTEILLLSDDLNQIFTPYKKGEIYVRGSCVSSGYYNDNELTKMAFVQNPLNDKFIDLVYKTGDIGYFNENYELVCAGRADNQIKLKGHRIELGEIECVLSTHEGVKNVACVFENERIFAFYESEIELDLREFLSIKLPKYMLPRHFIRVSKFKLNNNTKIDRKILKQIAKDFK
nr:amino acid adenylation domain-containing protein [Campylobacter mucosalis]